MLSGRGALHVLLQRVLRMLGMRLRLHLRRLRGLRGMAGHQDGGQKRLQGGRRISWEWGTAVQLFDDAVVERQSSAERQCDPPAPIHHHCTSALSVT